MSHDLLLRRSLHAIRELRQELDRHRAAEPVAIVGMSCRFPGGADSPEAFWRLLADGRDAVVPVPPDRWGGRSYLDPDPDVPGTTYTDRAGFLREDIHEFDAELFGIPAGEAAEMDPQQRLLLETSWAALESAGTRGGDRTGVFVGISGSEFAMLPRPAERIGPYTATGATVSIAAGRIAHALSLRGPALAVDTACSSSLVAVHLAVQSLRRGECDSALAGGVNALLSPGNFIVLSKMRALARDGRCKTFDAAADGYVRGEGCGMVVLRRLADARADGDPVLAVIHGSAVNQDGRSSGLTVPNGSAQRAVVEQALGQAGVAPGEVGYLEAHGTGTPLGDPIEMHALTEVLGRGRTPDRPLWIGAVKPAIGHLEAAAGIAGLIKTVLVLQHGEIPPNLHLTRLNPRLSPERIPARLPAALTPWESGGDRRVAGVSSFGFSGTNAHVVLAEAPAAAEQDTGVRSHLAVLSARTPDALRRYAADLAAHLESRPGLALAAVCHTLAVRRTHFPHRAAAVVSGIGELVDWLRDVKPAEPPQGADELSVLARQFLAGGDPRSDWTGQAVTLPSRPFSRVRHVAAAPGRPEAALPGRRVPSPLRTAQYEALVGPDTLPELRDNNEVLHIGYYHAMVAAAVRDLSGSRSYLLRDLEFVEALHFTGDAERIVQVVVEEADGDEERPCSVHSRPAAGDDWSVHLRAALYPRPTTTRMLTTRAALTERCSRPMSADDFHADLRSRGFRMGPAVTWVEQLSVGEGEALARFRPAEPGENRCGLAVHPGVLDAAVQLFAAAGRAELGGDAFITRRIAELLLVDRPAAGPLWGHATLREGLRGDIVVFADSGELVARATGVEIVRIDNRRREELVRQAAARPPAAHAGGDVTGYLTAAVTELLAGETPPPDRPLAEYGMDSLAVLELRRRIAADLGMDVPVEYLLQGPSIGDLAALLTSPGDGDDAVGAYRRDYDLNPESWLVHGSKRADADVRLFCVPYGVKGASLYSRWAKRLPYYVDVCPIQFPGKEQRIRERPIADLTEAVDALEQVLSSRLDRPVALYGHSVGALVAYRVAQRLSGTGRVSHLFVGAYTAPTVQPNPVYRRVMETFRVFGFDDVPALEDLAGASAEDHRRYEAFIREKFGIDVDDEVRAAVKPVGLADFRLVHTYRHDPDEPPLTIPVTAFHGERDTFVTEEEMRAWGKLTTGPFTCEVVPGDHFFLHGDQAEDRVVTTIARQLDR
ncbi:beta-ketoacyl synthase N-terminal-like domain-containing protein [Actinoplanes aureus]|uniref:Polyketide synthase dehydratase domain-containing protein n=1 Tax=Actinoplanes aureus TaxID=2792083 RepID=A0A931CHM3_9ACTN|nr:beta-ketoacyl synthase N-terminal-like domain-containing protein [Actinoplanes aureus]MBG0567757.1 polyketide synthase dehydratase domain-containing protein [Actinoplanes aureus]